jgi:DNA polymerase-3 subunit delta'
MSFADILGQDRAVEILKRDLSHGRVSHAYLFSGMESIGKKLTALAFAMAVQCDTLEHDACGECLVCRKIKAGIHPDVRLYAPVIKTKGSPAKIYIEQVRALQKEIALRPLEGRKKVFIIDDADVMVDQAANAFLKTLEEPPGDSLLILVTAYPGLLPRTVVSRCRRVHFRPLAQDALERILMNTQDLSRDQAKHGALLSSGSLKGILNLEAQDLIAKRDRFMEWKQGCDPGNIGSIFEVSERFSGNASEAIAFVEFLISWTRDMVSTKLRGSEGTLIHGDKAFELAEESGRKGLGELLRNAEILEETHGRLRMNLNQRLTLESALIQMD